MQPSKYTFYYLHPKINSDKILAGTRISLSLISVISPYPDEYNLNYKFCPSNSCILYYNTIKKLFCQELCSWTRSFHKIIIDK